MKQYLLKGYAINKKRLTEAQENFQKLQQAVIVLQKRSQSKQLQGQEKEILGLLSGYAKTLSTLEQFDKNKLPKPKGKKAKFVLEYQDCQQIIIKIKKK